MRISLVRHAQPAWVVDGKSVLDPRLSAQGQTQAERLAEAARHWTRPGAVWVSPTERTRQTAAPLLDTFQTTATIYPWMEEIRLPRQWEGASGHDVSAALYKARNRPAHAWWDGLEGGESFSDFEARVVQGLQTALAAVGVRALGEQVAGARLWSVDDPELRVVWVGHGGTNSVAISYLLGLPSVPWAWERLVAAHASVTRLVATPLLGAYVFGLREHSDVAHLPKALRSR